MDARKSEAEALFTEQHIRKKEAKVIAQSVAKAELQFLTERQIQVRFVRLLPSAVGASVLVG